MFKLNKLVLGEKMRMFMMAVFLVIFVVFSVQIILEEPELRLQIMYILVMLFFSFFFIISEVLRYFYQKATKYLVLDCNPDKAIQVANTLKKMDIIKGYHSPLLVFYTLVYMDQGDDEKLEEHLKSPAFQTSSSLKLIYHYNMFYIAIHQKDLDKASEYFKLINDAYKVKTKRKYAARPVYSLSQVSADYYLLKGNMNKTYDSLKNVVSTSLNNRELTYYYIAFAKYYAAEKNQKESLYLKDAREIGPELAHVKNYK
jgi:hypothetical protein